MVKEHKSTDQLLLDQSRHGFESMFSLLAWLCSISNHWCADSLGQASATGFQTCHIRTTNDFLTVEVLACHIHHLILNLLIIKKEDIASLLKRCHDGVGCIVCGPIVWWSPMADLKVDRTLVCTEGQMGWGLEILNSSLAQNFRTYRLLASHNWTTIRRYLEEMERLVCAAHAIIFPLQNTRYWQSLPTPR